MAEGEASEAVDLLNEYISHPGAEEKPHAEELLHDAKSTLVPQPDVTASRSSAPNSAQPTAPQTTTASTRPKSDKSADRDTAIATSAQEGTVLHVSIAEQAKDKLNELSWNRKYLGKRVRTTGVIGYDPKRGDAYFLRDPESPGETINVMYWQDWEDFKYLGLQIELEGTFTSPTSFVQSRKITTDAELEKMARDRAVAAAEFELRLARERERTLLDGQPPPPILSENLRSKSRSELKGTTTAIEGRVARIGVTNDAIDVVVAVIDSERTCSCHCHFNKWHQETLASINIGDKIAVWGNVDDLPPGSRFPDAVVITDCVLPEKPTRAVTAVDHAQFSTQLQPFPTRHRRFRWSKSTNLSSAMMQRRVTKRTNRLNPILALAYPKS